MEKLNDKKWDEFSLEDIFTVSPGKRLETRNKISGNRPFIGATDNGNGVTGFVANDNVSKDSNVLGVNYNGAPCIAFYHPYECIFTDDVKRLHLKNYIDNENTLLFFTEVFAKQRMKYNYGYKFKEKRMLRQKLMLPVTNSGELDYDFMADYIKRMRKKLITRYREYAEKRIDELGEEIEIPALGKKEWREFWVENLFQVTRPLARNKDAYDEGDVPFVASGTMRNGVMKCCKPHKDEPLDSRNCITVSPVDGSSFYQSIDFLGRGGAGSSILILRNDILNEFNGQFLARMIFQTCSKYTYGHMGNKENIKRERIMLPVNNSGGPDYNYMEQYVKNIMLRKYRQYLNFLDSHA